MPSPQFYAAELLFKTVSPVCPAYNGGSTPDPLDPTTWTFSAPGATAQQIAAAQAAIKAITPQQLVPVPLADPVAVLQAQVAALQVQVKAIAAPVATPLS